MTQRTRQTPPIRLAVSWKVADIPVIPQALNSKLETPDPKLKAFTKHRLACQCRTSLARRCPAHTRLGRPAAGHAFSVLGTVLGQPWA